MNISTLTLRDLEYLLAVSQEEHFGKAAQKVHVSQPALSSQIKKIEDFLGVMIFERSKRKVSVTPMGEKIVAQVRVVLEEAQKIPEIVQKQARPLTGPLHLGAIATFGPYFFPHILRPLRQKYPDLQLFLTEGLTNSLVEELKSGTLDAVLASPTFDDPALQIIPLFHEPFLLAVSLEHPLASKTPLRIQDLKTHEMIFLEEGHCLTKQAIDLCPTNRRGQMKSYQATGLETLRYMVANNLGHTLIPLLAVKNDPLMKKMIAYRPFEGRSLGREIALVCRRRFTRMDDIEKLVQFFRENHPPGTEVLTESRK